MTYVVHEICREVHIKHQNDAQCCRWIMILVPCPTAASSLNQLKSGIIYSTSLEWYYYYVVPSNSNLIIQSTVVLVLVTYKTHKNR